MEMLSMKTAEGATIELQVRRVNGKDGILLMLQRQDKTHWEGLSLKIHEADQLATWLETLLFDIQAGREGVAP